MKQAHSRLDVITEDESLSSTAGSVSQTPHLLYTPTTPS